MLEVLTAQAEVEIRNYEPTPVSLLDCEQHVLKNPLTTSNCAPAANGLYLVILTKSKLAFRGRYF